MPRSVLSHLPRVDAVALHPSLDALRKQLGTDMITRLVRLAIDEARTRVRQGAAVPTADELVTRVTEKAQATLMARAHRVINATGVVLHTNLGRAPLSVRAVEALAATAGHYTSVEMDLQTGRRGLRGAFCEAALVELSGAEAALVVNNNAAAVLLALAVIAGGMGHAAASGPGRAVIVSRGELIEIGGGFRVPEVMARSGARLVEVGTTNRTRLSDYRRALDTEPDAAAILRVHQGNFRQTGFVDRPSLRALADLARERGVALVKDLGGGALVDLATFGLSGEPTVRECVAAGCDLICFSTDKVLGGPQGGVLVGRAALIDRARRDPLARALRLGRLPLVALEATLAAYLEKATGEIPTIAMLSAPVEDVRARALRWQTALSARGVAAQVVALEGATGGGALPQEVIASAGLAIRCADANDVVARLRSGDPPIVARIHEETVLFDGRTVMAGQDEALLSGIVRAVKP